LGSTLKLAVTTLLLFRLTVKAASRALAMWFSKTSVIPVVAVLKALLLSSLLSS
jgi:hypothetical protein